MEEELVDENTPSFANIKNNKFELWDHQKKMISKCLYIEQVLKEFGIMSDPPGTGKTYVVLGIILGTFIEKERKMNIIVVPQNIYEQWKSAIESFCDLSKIKLRCFSQYSEINNLFGNSDILKDTDILLVNSMFYPVISSTLNMIKVPVERIFFDEIDTIQQLIREKMNAKYVWFISASFKQDKIGVYSSLSGIEKHVCRCKKELIEKSLNLTEPIYKTYECKSIFTEMIKDILPFKKISELNALDFNTNIYKFVKKVPKNEKEFLEFLFTDIEEIVVHNKNNIETLLIAKKETEECGFYNGSILKQKLDSILQQVQLSQNLIHASKSLKKLLIEKLKLHNICCLSLESLDTKEKIVSKCCGLSYKKESIQKDIKCLLCENIVNYPNGFLIEKRLLKLVTKDEIKKYKLEILKELIGQLKGKKNIIFSDYPSIFRQLEFYLIQEKVEFVTLDGGNSEMILQSVKNYKEGTSSFLLVDSSLNGCGMNFENTNNIIFLHKINTELEKQVIGRAQRPGRKSTLHIYRLYHQNEFVL